MARQPAGRAEGSPRPRVPARLEGRDAPRAHPEPRTWEPGGWEFAGGNGEQKEAGDRQPGSGREGRRVHFHKKAEIAAGGRISCPWRPSPIARFLQEAGSGAQRPKCALWSLMVLIKWGFKCCPERGRFPVWVCSGRTAPGESRARGSGQGRSRAEAKPA